MKTNDFIIFCAMNICLNSIFFFKTVFKRRNSIFYKVFFS